MDVLACPVCGNLMLNTCFHFYEGGKVKSIVMPVEKAIELKRLHIMRAENEVEHQRLAMESLLNVAAGKSPSNLANLSESMRMNYIPK